MTDLTGKAVEFYLDSEEVKRHHKTGSNPNKKLRRGKTYFVEKEEVHNGVYLVEIRGVSGKFEKFNFREIQ